MKDLLNTKIFNKNHTKLTNSFDLRSSSETYFLSFQGKELSKIKNLILIN